MTGSRDGKIRILDIATQSTSAVSPDIGSPIETVMFTCHGKQIVCGLSVGAVQVWDAVFSKETSEEEIRHSHDGHFRLWYSKSGAYISDSIEEYDSSVRCVSFRPDGEKMVIVVGNFVRVWLFEDCLEQRYKLDGESVSCASFCSDSLRIITGSTDTSVRIWSTETLLQIGNDLNGRRSAISEVSESSDGRYIVSQSSDKETFIWCRASHSIVWTSVKRYSTSGIKIKDIDAANIIRSCGMLALHLWPEWRDSFPSCTAEVSCNGDIVYSNTTDKNLVLGAGVAISAWKYDTRSKVFATGLESGRIAICKFVS